MKKVAIILIGLFVGATAFAQSGKVGPHGADKVSCADVVKELQAKGGAVATDGTGKKPAAKKAD